MTAAGLPSASRSLSSVGTFLDLRSDDERAEEDHNVVVQLCGEDYKRKSIICPILGRPMVPIGMARVLPREQSLGLLRQVVMDPMRSRTLITASLDTGGLTLLNKIMIKAGGWGIARALTEITDALRREQRKAEKKASSQAADSRKESPNGHQDYLRNWVDEEPVQPVFFFCSAGKDRTGLIAALVLSILGASDEEIVADYVRSTDTWENGAYHLRQRYSGKDFDGNASASCG